MARSNRSCWTRTATSSPVGRRVRAATHARLVAYLGCVPGQPHQEEAFALELEENIKREDLIWWEQVIAIERYHRMREDQDPDWTR